LAVDLPLGRISRSCAGFPRSGRDRGPAPQGRWTTVQSSFVDNPQKAVEEASALVSSAIKEIDEWFKNQRTEIDKQRKGTSATTEGLRVVLQQYRDFFDRLLSL
jgi:hypothetical protein